MWLLHCWNLELQISEYVYFTLYTFGICIVFGILLLVLWFDTGMIYSRCVCLFFSKHSIWSQLPTTQFHPRRRFPVKLTKISISMLHQSLFLFLTSKVGDFLLPLTGTKIEEQEHELQNLNSAIAAKVMGFPKNGWCCCFDDWNWRH